MFIQLLNKLIEKQDLTTEEAQNLVGEMMSDNIPPAQIAGLLTGLRMKGETIDEILGCIQAMRNHMATVKTDGIVIDTCGTGGDGAGTFNISTTVAFVVAGTGVKVAKHGNRNASSQCGSADVLEALGVNIQLTPEQAAKVLEKVGMVFLFAPLYHASMKNIALVRKELGIRTIFNVLGPFCNPAQVKRQLIGVPNRAIAEKLAQVAKHLDYDHLMIVSNEEGLDEVGISSITHVFEIKKDHDISTVSELMIYPEQLGFKQISTDHLKGGNAEDNARITKDILTGQKGPKRDIVILNSALALVVSGKVKDIHEGITIAEKSIDSGKAKKVLESLTCKL